MKIFITGTDTHVGKTLIASWIALHTGFAYFKPIQTGTREEVDSDSIQQLANVTIYPEIYRYPEPLSPHLAAQLAGETIAIEQIHLPCKNRLVVEGAGGVLVPLNRQQLMIDLIQKLDLPTILVARTNLGTINHTLLSLEALQLRGIPVLGVIMNGETNHENRRAIEFYSGIPVIAEFPKLPEISQEALKRVALSQKLTEILLGR